MTVEPGVVLRVLVRKETDLSARVSFVDASGAHAAWPPAVTVASIPGGQVHNVHGDVVIIFWSESYALLHGVRPIMYIHNQRQQAFGVAAGVPLANFVPPPVPPPSIPQGAQLVNGVGVVPGIPVLEDDDDDDQMGGVEPAAGQ